MTHRVEYAPTPCIKATRTPLNGVTILSRKNLGKEEVNCGDAGHLAAEKVESQLVIDSQQVGAVKGCWLSVCYGYLNAGRPLISAVLPRSGVWFHDSVCVLMAGQAQV